MRAARSIPLLLLALSLMLATRSLSTTASEAPTESLQLPPLRTPVPQLNAAQFEEMVHSGRPTLVEFFAPWCGHCKNMLPHYEEAAVKMLEQEESAQAQLAKVDCMEERELCGRFGVTGFPTIKLIRYGEGESRNSPLHMYMFNMQRTTLSFLVFCSTMWRTLPFITFPELGHEAEMMHPNVQMQGPKHPGPEPSPPEKLTLQQRWQQQENERLAVAGLPPMVPEPPAPSPPPVGVVAVEAPAPTDAASVPTPTDAAVTPTSIEAAAEQATEVPPPSNPAAVQAAADSNAAANDAMLRKQRRLRRADTESTKVSSVAGAVATPGHGSTKLAAVKARAEAAAAAAAAAAAELAAAEAEEAAHPQQQDVSDAPFHNGVELSANDEAADPPSAPVPRQSRVGLILFIFFIVFAGAGLMLRRHWAYIKRRYTRHHSLQLGKGI